MSITKLIHSIFHSLCAKHSVLTENEGTDIRCSKCGRMLGIVCWGNGEPRIYIISKFSRWKNLIIQRTKEQIRVSGVPHWVTLNAKERANIIEPWSPLDAILEPIDESNYIDNTEPRGDDFYIEERRRLEKIEDVLNRQRDELLKQTKILEELK